MSLQEAFDNFMNTDFESAVENATEISWSGRNKSLLLELLPDGHYNLMYSGSVGNHYRSKGLLLTVPYLEDDEWDDDPSMRLHDNAEEGIRLNFEAAIDLLKESKKLDMFLEPGDIDITIPTDSGTVKYSVIKISEARNRDGSNPSPLNEPGYVVEGIFTPNDSNKRPNITNYWHIKTVVHWQEHISRVHGIRRTDNAEIAKIGICG